MIRPPPSRRSRSTKTANCDDGRTRVGRVLNREYDGQFNLTSVADLTGLSARFTYDKTGNLLTATDPAGVR